MTLTQATRDAVDQTLTLYDADEAPYVEQAIALGEALRKIVNELAELS